MQGSNFSIIKRKKNGRELGPWQLRVIVPTELRSAVGKQEIWRSLKTSDRKIADRRAVDVLASIFGSWTPKGTPATDQADLVGMAVDRGFTQLLERLEIDRQRQPKDDQSHSTMAVKRQADLQRFARHKRDGNLESWQSLADNFIAKDGLDLPKNSEAYGSFVNAIAEANIEALSVFNRRNEGDLHAAPRSALVRAVIEKQADTAPPGETLLEMFERYAAQRTAETRKRVDTINQDRKVVERFTAFVGAKRSVRSISRDDVVKWRDTIAALPPNYKKTKIYQGLSDDAVAAKARRLGTAGPAPTTVNKYLSTISPLFAWMCTNGHADTNPCDRLYFDIPKGSNPRPPFSTDQLNAMLGSPLFNGFLRDGKEHLPGNMRADDWRYWTPLVAMLSGARIGEVAQLRVDDVKDSNGIWFIHIRDDASTGQTTKSGHSRPAPVHSILKALGFLEFVDRQRERSEPVGNAQLFPELKPDSRGQIGGKPSRFWRKHLTAIGIKKGKDGYGAHSFRHTMADRLREEAELLDDQIEVALGHNQKTVTSGYGRIRQGTVSMMHGWFEQVTFEGVNFDHLMPAGMDSPARRSGSRIS